MLRATVQIRNGSTRGSGTVVASAPGETLVLTAAHVVAGAPGVKVELHRHNLGGRLVGLTEGGGWPRLVPGAVAASDPASDVALVRVRGMVALPHVARLDLEAAEPAPGETLTSVGVDRTLRLTLWRATVVGAVRVDLGKGGGPRRFTLTDRWPEHGRSGGGLFRADGSLAGVCVAQARFGSADRRGAFASLGGVRDLFRKSGLPAPQGTAADAARRHTGGEAGGATGPAEGAAGREPRRPAPASRPAR